MAGGNWNAVKIDPAIERWAHMRENVYQNFKFTPKTTKQVVIYGLVLPALTATIAIAFNKKYDWAGKQKGSSLLAGTPAKPVPTEK
ncbi:uncharacterized protein L203_105622 [Cryptococcus depauperatus CBS 7841]|uniref:NADH dehydrogenase [ubiquinone] 1 beta subcomplex subunit 4 n=1 Tax=Cryptococcus depauperatus CBS 7841 TaxID=1295531 RepID=A0A1E3IH14_9TREE|nr:hypothetical protein L203_03498 [Cryptococcus depauperatus CBS 7841]ODN98642.1 hypothetical protein L204_02606 [Cryptococcus depauperatus CBS 7855]